MNLNKHWQKIMFGKMQYQNKYVTLILAQIGDISSKWNHATVYTVPQKKGQIIPKKRVPKWGVYYSAIYCTTKKGANRSQKTCS